MKNVSCILQEKPYGLLGQPNIAKVAYGVLHTHNHKYILFMEHFPKKSLKEAWFNLFRINQILFLF